MENGGITKGIGHGYWRVVAEVEDLLDLAAQFKQRTLYGIGFARKLIGVSAYRRRIPPAALAARGVGDCSTGQRIV